MATMYEVRFQTVDPDRRTEYVKMYKQAIQEIKLAGCRCRAHPVQRNRPRPRTGGVGMGIQGASSALARHAAAHTLSRRRRRLANEAKHRGGYYLAETI
jgi:hypothetical protein